MEIGTKIALKSSGTEGVVIKGNHRNDSVPTSLVYVKLKSGKKFYYQPDELKSLKKKAAPKKAAPVKEKVKEPVAKKTATKKEKKN